MNIFDYALKMEKEGEDFYHQLAEKADNEGIRKILLKLAEDEVKHYKIINSMKENEKINYDDSVIVDTVKTIFEEMKKKIKDVKPDTDQIELYEKARYIEKESQEFYEKKAGEAKDEANKNILLKLADEEKQHFFILDNIVELISKPEWWVESPEFNPYIEY